MSLNIGDIIDEKYRIVRLLGEGGMGAVYEGENTRIHRKVAIKILHSNVAQSKDAVQRFEREAQAAGRIGSEHIVEVLDLGELPDGDRYMVMEFLEGEALSDRIESSQGISPQKTALLIIDMLEGLKAAHAAGIVHRDLKPDNVFLLTSKSGKRDFVKIVDFGISKFSTLGGEFSMTQTGAVMGTPYYLSPEQAKGERNVDHRSDLYAVGVILWEAVAGRVPFDGETFNELLFKIVLEPIPDLKQFVPDIDPHFVSIVDKAMARDPGLRFQSAEDMQIALSQWLEGQPPAPELLADAASAKNATINRGSYVDGALQATALGQQAPVQATSANWANTNAPTEKSGSKMWIGVAAAAVVLLGVTGVFIQQRGAAEEARLAAQAAEEQRTREEAAAREADMARIEVEKAKAEAEKAKAEQARIEAEQAKALAEMSAAERARAAEDERRAAEEERLAAQRAAARRPASSAPAPAPAPSSGGRRIREEL